MCGIAGIVGLDARERAFRVRAMRDTLAHRGPDSAGEHIDPHAALGVRRLRVIDLVTGDQPFANEDGTIWTVFNGEIYNFGALREQLESRGHRFRSRTDTEVIPHLYEDYGDRFVEHLDGMFALAVWDMPRRRLVLARDRLGKKPLLYLERGGELLFASEHQALLAVADCGPVDRDAIRLYLRLGYVPAPRDALGDVRKLLPAHVLTWENGVSTTRAYWHLPEPGTLRIDEAEAITEFRRLLDAAVARRLIADVPVGAFLSGGLDSSAVVATMARQAKTVRTFTIDFPDRGYSEAAHARRIAQQYGTEHHEFLVEPHALEILPDLVRHYGEPYADSSAIPTFYLSRLTRQHVTVALNGDGGDELFAGYERYFAARAASALDVIPAPIRRPLLGAAAWALPDSISPRSRARRAKRFLQAASLPPTERYLRWVGVFDGPTLGVLLDPAFAEETEAADHAFAAGSVGAVIPRDPVAAAQYHDFAHYLPDDLLVKVDIASMANSLEVRSPFLDRELVEFAARLPMDLKIHGTQRKYIVKRAFADQLPRESLHRRKQGFALPIGEWLRGELRPLVEDLVLSPTAAGRGYFRPEALSRLVNDHLSSRVDHTHRLWALVMLELWHREVDEARRPVALAS